MIEKYFSAPKTVRRLRAGLSGPHIDGFAETLEHRGYSHATAIRYLRAAAHLGCSPNALHKLTAAGGFPFQQDCPGAKLYFKRSELDDSRERGAHGSGTTSPCASKMLP